MKFKDLEKWQIRKILAFSLSIILFLTAYLIFACTQLYQDKVAEDNYWTSGLETAPGVREEVAKINENATKVSVGTYVEDLKELSLKSNSFALFFGLLMRKDGKIVLKRIFLTIGAVALTSAILSTAITVWRDGGIPTSVWEIRFFTDAIHKGVPKIFACLYGVFLVKIFDSIVVGGATVLLYLLVPKKIRNAETRATTAAANITIHT